MFPRFVQFCIILVLLAVLYSLLVPFTHRTVDCLLTVVSATPLGFKQLVGSHKDVLLVPCCPLLSWKSGAILSALTIFTARPTSTIELSGTVGLCRMLVRTSKSINCCRPSKRALCLITFLVLWHIQRNATWLPSLAMGALRRLLPRLVIHYLLIWRCWGLLNVLARSPPLHWQTHVCVVRPRYG